jgi:hypothetical protein
VRSPERLGGVGFGGTRTGGRAVRVLGVLAILGLSLVLAPAADASPMSFTWSGQSTITEDWSASANWAGDVEPTTGEAIGTLTFPRLTNEVCEEGLGTEPCYISYNNVSGLSAESVQIDDANDYLIGGNEIAIGSGGLTASPAAVTSELTVAELDLPVALGATQTWDIGGEGSGHLLENDLYLGGNLTGSGSALTVDMSDGPALLLRNKTEVGPVTINGTNAGEYGIYNGAVELFGGELNSADKNPVGLSHIFFIGDGEVGPLTTNEAELDVGGGGKSTGDIRTPSATFDEASEVIFQVVGSGGDAGTEYSQLLSSGTVKLGNAGLEVFVRPPEKGKSCLTLTPGQKYTFVSTTGTLSGSFSNAPEGGHEISIKFAEECDHPAQTMQIAYNRSGGTETVTGTVEEAKAKQEAKERQEAKEKQEEEAATKKRKEEEAATKRHEEEVKNEEAIKKLVEEHAKQVGEETAAKEVAAEKQQEEVAAAASKQHQEEEAGINHKHEEEAATKKKEEEENAPTGNVLLNGSTITVQSSGEAQVKLACAGTTKCAGKLTLTVKVAARKGKKAKTETLGTATFSIQPNETTSIKLTLGAAAKALLGADHGRLGATLLILRSSPSPSQTHTDSVHLVQQKAHGTAKK